jgi:hypothetical protein
MNFPWAVVSDSFDSLGLFRVSRLSNGVDGAFHTLTFQGYLLVNRLRSGRIQPFEISCERGDEDAPHLDDRRTDRNSGIPHAEKGLRTVFAARKDDETPLRLFV